MTPDCSVIIPHLDGLEALQDCVTSVAALTGPSVEIIVVDNGSRDGSAEWLRQRHPAVRLVRNDVNRGFAPACNQGAGLARGRMLLFLNDDTRVPPDLLSKLLRPFEESPEIGAAQPKIYLMDDPQRLDALGGFPTWTGFLHHWGHRELDRDLGTAPINVFSPKGACLAVRAELFRQVGGFDDAFFAYCEETDLAWRIWLAGRRVVLVPTVGILHRMGHTSMRVLQFEFIQYHAHKNRLAMYVKNLGAARLPFVLLVNGGLLLVLAGLGLVTGQWRHAMAILRAIAWNVGHLPALLRKRRQIQRVLRAVPDRVLFRPMLRPVTWARAWQGGVLWFLTPRRHPAVQSAP